MDRFHDQFYFSPELSSDSDDSDSESSGRHVRKPRSKPRPRPQLGREAQRALRDALGALEERVEVQEKPERGIPYFWVTFKRPAHNHRYVYASERWMDTPNGSISGGPHQNLFSYRGNRVTGNILAVKYRYISGLNHAVIVVVCDDNQATYYQINCPAYQGAEAQAVLTTLEDLASRYPRQPAPEEAPAKP